MCSTIQFNFALDKGPLKVLLEADVEHDGQGLYLAKNFRIPGNSHTGILPDIRIRKVNGHWVHRDSGWHTELSEALGEAIDRSMVAL